MVMQQQQRIAATPSQWASAATHLEMRSEWRTVRIDDIRYVVLVSGNSGRVYMVRADAAGCGCVFYVQTGRQCSHMLSVELAAMEDELAEQPAPKLLGQQIWGADDIDLDAHRLTAAF